MPKPMKPQIVTANDLFEGDAIYFTAAGDWSRDHAEAAVAHDREAADALLARASAQQEKVVGPYLTETGFDEAGRPVPTHYRERMRMRGPSIPVGPDNALLGKQAEA